MANIVAQIVASEEFSPEFQGAVIKASAFAKRALATKLYPSYMDVEDLTQEALVEVLKSVETFDDGLDVPFEAWAVKHIQWRYQHIRDLAKKGPFTVFQQVQAQFSDYNNTGKEVGFIRNGPDCPVDDMAVASPPDPQNVAEDVEIVLLVTDFIETLATARQKKVFGYLLLGWCQEDIGKILHISQKTVSRELEKIKTAFYLFCVNNHLKSWEDKFATKNGKAA